MKIDHILQRLKSHDLNNQAKAEDIKEAAKSKGKSSGKLITDTVSISEQARSLQRAEAGLKALKSHLDAQSSVRKDKVELARARIAGGKLLIDEVVEGTAEAILKSGALSDIINKDMLLLRARLSGTRSPEAGAEKLAQVKERISSGYYDRPEVVDDIAETILEDLLG